MIDVGTVAVGASLVPVVVGLRRGYPSGWKRVVWWWLVVLAVENLILRWMSWHHLATWAVTWYAYPVTLALGVWALLAFPTMAPNRGHRWPLIGGFFVAWLLAPLLPDRQSGFSVFIAPLHALLLMAGGVWLLFRATGPHRKLRAPPVLTGAATFLTYGPFVAIWPVSVYLSAVSPEWLVPLWLVRAALLVVGSFLYAAAMW